MCNLPSQRTFCILMALLIVDIGSIKGSKNVDSLQVFGGPETGYMLIDTWMLKLVWPVATVSTKSELPIKANAVVMQVICGRHTGYMNLLIVFSFRHFFNFWFWGIVMWQFSVICHASSHALHRSFSALISFLSILENVSSCGFTVLHAVCSLACSVAFKAKGIIPCLQHFE